MRTTDFSHGEGNVVGERSEVEIAEAKVSFAERPARENDRLSSKEIRREHSSSSFLVLGVLLPSLMLNHVENIGDVRDISTRLRQLLVDGLGEELDVPLGVRLDVLHQKTRIVGLKRGHIVNSASRRRASGLTSAISSRSITSRSWSRLATRCCNSRAQSRL